MTSSRLASYPGFDHANGKPLPSPLEAEKEVGSPFLVADVLRLGHSTCRATKPKPRSVSSCDDRSFLYVYTNALPLG